MISNVADTESENDPLIVDSRRLFNFKQPESSSKSNTDTQTLSQSQAVTERELQLHQNRLKGPLSIKRDLRDLEIVGVFVVAFDIKHGNVLEWCKPDYLKPQLSGLEFKALPSGAHTLDNDFVYFYVDGLYGLACYEKMSVETAGERGVRMKSVGILSYSFQLLHIHKDEICKLTRFALEHPGNYSALELYHSNWIGDLLLRNSAFLHKLNTRCPAAWCEDFASTFASSMFTIWKAILLQKRILFYSPPPASRISSWVFCSTLLASYRQSGILDSCVPHFYVNIADSSFLDNQASYIACTTEKVFESKHCLYDVYVDQAKVVVVNKRLRAALEPNYGDKQRHDSLQAAMLNVFVDEDGQIGSLEECFYRFFTSLNTAVLDTLGQLISTDQLNVTRKDMNAMSLSSSDSDFLAELIDVLGYDLTLRCNLCPCL